MKGYEPEKYICYSLCPQHDVKFHRTVMSYIIGISILTLIWMIFAMIFRPPKFDNDLATAGSVLSIIALILIVLIFVYTLINYYKYGKNENPDSDHIQTYKKVILVLLILSFLILVGMFIVLFLMIIMFIENYDYNLDTAWVAFKAVVMLICLFATVWEIYLVVMLFVEGEKPRIHVPTKTKVIKSTPVYTNTTAQNNIEYQQEGQDGFEDDFMGMNVQGGKYIGDSTSQASDQKDPQLGPKKVEGNEDDFFGPNMDQGNDQYVNENTKKDNDAQFYPEENQNPDLNKKGNDKDQPL